MKPIEVIIDLVDKNPNDQMLGEVVRQYIRENYGFKKVKKYLYFLSIVIFIVVYIYNRRYIDG